jgi:hypothetical protein
VSPSLQRRVEVLEAQMAELIGSQRPAPERLSDDEVREIRSQVAAGVTLAELGRRYGRSRRTIACIRDREWYPSVPD